MSARFQIYPFSKCAVVDEFSLLVCQTRTNAKCIMAAANTFAPTLTVVFAAAAGQHSLWATTSGHAKVIDKVSLSKVLICC